MSYNNNKKNLITVKVTAKGREKIATGNLNLAKWSIGDSEVNYVREDYLVDNNINDKPSRVLKAVDQQPNLKYYVTNNDGDIRNTLNNGDISVLKLITNNNTTERGFYLPNDITTINSALTKANGVFNFTAFNNNVINGTYIGVEVGDLILIRSGFDLTNYKSQCYYEVISFTSNTITVNRNLPISNSGSCEYHVFFSGEVSSVNRWNTPVNFTWNGDVLDYDMQMPPNYNYGTKVWDFNILTMENIAGYYNLESTLGYEFIGLMENYLSYNDELNVDSENTDNTFCSNELTDGIIDSYQKMIGVIHFTNDNYSNLYGDVFYIDIPRNKNFNLKIPNVLHHKFPTDKIELSAFGTKKYILDSDIEYYDMGFDAENIVGKVLPQYKVFIIEDEELLMAMSIGSGRSFTLPTIKSQLIPSAASEGILPNGKQMFITYNISNENNNTFNKHIHCNKYNKIINSTPTSKDIVITFDVNDLNLLYGKQHSIAAVQNFSVLYQITDIGSRPISNNWLKLDLSEDLGIDDVTTSLLSNTEAIESLNYNLVKTDVSRSTLYDIRTTFALNNDTGLIGDETFFLGNLTASISSNIYRSIISLNINPNVFVKTTNPTYNDVSGVKPYISVSEIGIYDNDDDLVMIGKLTKPQSLLNNSTIKLELGLDF